MYFSYIIFNTPPGKQAADLNRKAGYGPGISSIQVGAKVMATIFFFDDTSPVGKCDIYRRKDKVLTTCVDTMPADIPDDAYTFVIRSHISTK